MKRLSRWKLAKWTVFIALIAFIEIFGRYREPERESDPSKDGFDQATEAIGDVNDFQDRWNGWRGSCYRARNALHSLLPPHVQLPSKAKRFADNRTRASPSVANVNLDGAALMALGIDGGDAPFCGQRLAGESRSERQR